MPSVRIEIETDDAALRAAFKRLTATLGDLRPEMDEIGQSLVTSVIDRFERERGPGGAPWKTSARAGREGGRTLSDSGRLRASITHRAGRDSVEVGTNVAYAAIHQFGGKTAPRTIRPRNKKALYWPGARHPVAQVNHPGSTIPARPFLGIDEDDRASILRIVSRAIERAVS